MSVDGTGNFAKAGKALFDEGVERVELKLEANLFVQGCVCVCVCARAHPDLGLASSAVLLEGKTTAANSLVHHQPMFQPHNGGGLGNHSRPPTQKRNENNI